MAPNIPLTLYRFGTAPADLSGEKGITAELPTPGDANKLHNSTVNATEHRVINDGESTGEVFGLHRKRAVNAHEHA